MDLTMALTAQANDLVELTSRRSASERRRMLIAMIDLCAAAPPAKRAQVHAAVEGVFQALVPQADREFRTYLAKRLAACDWAPPNLVCLLGLDEITIAHLVIQTSPLLADSHLIRILVEAGIEHQTEVARRPNIGTAVTDAVIRHGDPSVLAALAANPNAELTDEAVAHLVGAARRFSGLRAPLAHHPRLTQALGEQLYAYVGQDLRAVISERFRVDTGALEDRASAAVDAARQAAAARQNGPRERERELDARLLAKAQAEGRLKPAFLTQVLKERRLALFQIALAKLGGFSLPAVKRACDAADTEALALACATVGVDRAVFPALVEMLRALNEGRPAGGWNAGGKAGAAFGRGPISAARAFRELVGGV
jgi:uncharacterized protein (DUF2336 family)